MVLHPRDTGAHELHGVHAPPKRGRTTGTALDSASDLARRYDPGDDRLEDDIVARPRCLDDG